MSEVLEKEEQSTELVVLPPADTALDVYQVPSGLDPYIERIRLAVMDHVPDLTTKKGRDAIASLSFKVRKSKTALDNLGKQLVDDLKEIPKKIDAERKRMRETLDAIADEVRRPLTEWEQAEEARTGALRAGVAQLRDLSACLEGLSVVELQARLDEAESEALGDHWQEYETEAARAKDASIKTLKTAIASREKYEAEQAELTRLRAEAEARRVQDEKDRIAHEAAEAATRVAEAKAQEERDAAARREADAKAATERAEREKQDAIERQKQAEARAETERLAAEQRANQAAEAARQAEIDRQEREKAEAAAEQRQREANRAHKAKINSAAAAALVAAGLTPEAAKLTITLIAQGKVPAVTINY